MKRFAKSLTGVLTSESHSVIFSFFNREAEVGSALETAMEALWIGGATFFGLGTLILEVQ